MIATTQEQLANWTSAAKEEDMLLELFNIPQRGKNRSTQPNALKLSEEGKTCLRDN